MTDTVAAEQQQNTEIEDIVFNEAPDIEEGVYPAILTKLERVAGTNFDTGDPEDFMSWHFSVKNGGETVELRGNTSMATGPASKAYKWATALLGRERMSRTNLKLNVRDELVGAACSVEVGFKADGYPKIANVMPPAKG